MTTRGGNSIDLNYDALSSMDISKYGENEWLLLIDGKVVYHDSLEEAVLDYAEAHFPECVPCLIKVPASVPFTGA